MSTTRGDGRSLSFNSYCSTCSGVSPSVIFANRFATSNSAFCIAPWASSSAKPSLSRMIKTRWTKELKRDAAAPGPHISRNDSAKRSGFFVPAFRTSEPPRNSLPPTAAPAL